MPVTEAAESSDVEARLTESLRLARREVKLVRGEHEVVVETLQRVRRQRAGLREQVQILSDALAKVLAERYWAEEPTTRRSLLGRRASDADDERELVAAVEAADLFDAGWYLRHNPEVVEQGLSPAQHYVRTGAARGREPGPGFDTPRYLREHPEARDAGVPPLVHHLRLGRS